MLSDLVFASLYMLHVDQNEILIYMGSRKKNLSWGKTASLSLDAIAILSGSKVRVVWLADVLEVNPRTVYRILDILREKDFPLRSKRRGREVFYWMDPVKTTEWFTSAKEMKKDLVQEIRTKLKRKKVLEAVL